MTLQPLATIRECASSSQIGSIDDDDVEQNVYSVTSISGKGLGMVSTEDIPPGKLIIEERPLLTVPLTASGDLPGKVFTRQSWHTIYLAYLNVDSN